MVFIYDAVFETSLTVDLMQGIERFIFSSSDTLIASRRCTSGELKDKPYYYLLFCLGFKKKQNQQECSRNLYTYINIFNRIKEKNNIFPIF